MFSSIFNHLLIELYNADVLIHVSPLMMTFMTYKRLGKGGGVGKYYTDSANNEQIEDHSFDDYFMQAKGSEPSGIWFDPSEMIDGIKHGHTVDHAVFSNLLAGRSQTGKKLTGTVDSQHVAGFDVTFSVPKSVSTIWAVANNEQRVLIESALACANKEALLFLSEKAGVAPRGKNGKKLETAHLVAATWPHSSSRNSDPQRHFHNIIFNLCQRRDATFGVIESKHLMQWQTAVGAYFRAAVAHHLHQEFPGLQFKKDGQGSFVICDVPPELIRHWSSRSNEINESIAEGGLEGTVWQRDEVWAKTRVSKGFSETPASMRERWLLEANSFGFNVLNALKEGQHNPIHDDGAWRNAGAALTRSESIFTEQALFRRVAEQSIGASLSEIKRRVVEVKIGMIKLGVDGTQRTIYSTLERFKDEVSLNTYAKYLSTDGQHVINQSALNMAIARNSMMSNELAASVHHVCSPGSIKVVESAAGDDKSMVIDAVRRVFEEQGYSTNGLALRYSRAHELQTDVKIKSCEITSFLADVTNGAAKVDDKTLIIVGDYSLVNSDFANQLLKIVCGRGAKLIILGEGMWNNSTAIESAMHIMMEAIGAVRLGDLCSQMGELQQNSYTNDPDKTPDTYRQAIGGDVRLDSIKRQYFRYRDKDSTLDYINHIDAVLRKEVQADVDSGMRNIYLQPRSVTTEVFKQEVLDDVKTMQASSNVELTESMSRLKEAMQKKVTLIS